MFTILQVLVIFILLLLLIAAWWYLSIPSNLPPGPIGFPIFGSTFDVLDPNDLPRKCLEWTKLYGPVSKFYVAEKLVLLLSGYDAIHEALVKQGEVYAGRPFDHEFLSADAEKKLGFKVPSDDEVWKEERRFLVTTLRDFGGRSIFEPKIKQQVERLLEQIGQHQERPFDPTDLLHKRTANVLTEFLFGKSFDDDQEDYSTVLKLTRDEAEEEISFLSPFILSDFLVPLLKKLPQMKKFEDNAITIIRFLQKEIAQQKLEFDAKMNSDYAPTNYVQAFFKAQENAGASSTFYTYDHLVFNLYQLNSAGAITIVTDLNWIILHMARNPELQEEVYQEILTQTGSSDIPCYADRAKLPLTEASIMESQRLEARLGAVRKTLAPSKLFGYDIPPGTVVMPLMETIMNDPKVFPNPDEFDVRRFLKSECSQEDYKKRLAYHLPFQLGKRSCPGDSLAKMELFLFFTGLITRYQFSFSPDEPIPSTKGNQVLIGTIPVPFKICAKARKD